MVGLPNCMVALHIKACRCLVAPAAGSLLMLHESRSGRLPGTEGAPAGWPPSAGYWQLEGPRVGLPAELLAHPTILMIAGIIQQAIRCSRPGL